MQWAVLLGAYINFIKIPGGENQLIVSLIHEME
jgi:hypothetical protein